MIERESRQLKREGSQTAFNLRNKHKEVTLGATSKNLTEEKKEPMDFLGGGDIADFYEKRVTSKEMYDKI